MSVDLSNLVALTGQLQSATAQAAAATDPTVKAILNSQVVMLTAQIGNEATHTQSQIDASNNALNSLGLFSTLTTAVGSAAPSILALFGK
jgi:hypothetical protein